MSFLWVVSYLAWNYSAALWDINSCAHHIWNGLSLHQNVPIRQFNLYKPTNSWNYQFNLCLNQFAPCDEIFSRKYQILSHLNWQGWAVIQLWDGHWFCEWVGWWGFLFRGNHPINWSTSYRQQFFATSSWPVEIFSGKNKEVFASCWSCGLFFCSCPFKVNAIIGAKCKNVKTFDSHTLLSIEAKFDKTITQKYWVNGRKVFYSCAIFQRRKKARKGLLNAHLIFQSKKELF